MGTAGVVKTYEDLGTRSVYLEHGSVSASHRIMCDGITFPCTWYQLPVPKYTVDKNTLHLIFGFFSGRRWPGHNHFHFECNIFKCISLSKNYCCVIIFSQKCVPEGVIDNKSPLFKVTVWHWNGDNPLPEQMLMHYNDTLVHQPGSLSSVLHIYIKCISCYPANLCLIMYLACYNRF